MEDKKLSEMTVSEINKAYIDWLLDDTKEGCDAVSAPDYISELARRADQRDKVRRYIEQVSFQDTFYQNSWKEIQTQCLNILTNK